jgi:hypothetical protein
MNHIRITLLIKKNYLWTSYRSWKHFDDFILAWVLEEYRRHRLKLSQKRKTCWHIESLTQTVHLKNALLEDCREHLYLPVTAWYKLLWMEIPSTQLLEKTQFVQITLRISFFKKKNLKEKLMSTKYHLIIICKFERAICLYLYICFMKSYTVSKYRVYWHRNKIKQKALQPFSG